MPHSSSAVPNVSTPVAPPAELLTRAEASGYTETSRHDEVIAYCDALAAESPLVQRTSLGRSGEGQDIVALILSDRGAFTPEEARAQGKIIVMIEANIHAGEVEGKEAALALARDLVRRKKGHKILGRVCLVIIPDINPDGNDRISPNNRALDLANLEGQVNPPGGVGTRYTGAGWNLNRDAMKQEAPETAALAPFYQRWYPHIFIDCHTTDGSIHACDLTFDTSHSNQHLFAALLGKSRKMLERCAARIEERHGYKATWYGNFVVEDQPETGWHTYPALPRFGSHYRGLLGRIDVLLETYSYISYPRRCAVIYAWLAELVRTAAVKRDKLLRAVEAEEARIIARGLAADARDRVGIHYGVARRDASGELVYSYPAYALDGDTVKVPGFEREALRDRQYPGEQPTTWTVPHLRAFVPTAMVTVPFGYVVTVPIAARLAGHGLRVEVLEEAVTLEVESYVILASEKTFSPDVAGRVPPPGESEVPLSQKPPPSRFETVLSVRPERRTLTFPAGTMVVPTAQRAGTLATYLLEPHSDDGLVRWEFLDAWLQVGELYPVHRLTGPVPERRNKAE